MFIAILGRQPEISVAELERVFGHDNVNAVSEYAATVDTKDLDIQRLGGSLKAGEVIDEINSPNWHDVSQKVVSLLLRELASAEGKITLGISAYGFKVDAREVQKTGIIAKQKLKKSGVNIRLIPNSEPALNTATSHHNKLGLSENKIELFIINSGRKTIVANSTGAQNITAYANRDQNRPKRDPYVGMLPPKLAQIMTNLAVGQSTNGRLLDPFCGTGVILQEAALLGFEIYGTDLSDKMIEYSDANIRWLSQKTKIQLIGRLAKATPWVQAGINLSTL